MNTKSKKITTTIVVVVVIVAIVAGILAYYYTQPSKSSGGTIKIGFFAQLTGADAADGHSALNGAKIAVDYINSHGGVLGKKIELVVYDDQMNPQQAIAVSHKLIEDDHVVAAVSGSVSSTTLAAAPVYETEHVPLVDAYAVNPDITKGKHYVFRVAMMGETEGKALGYAAVNYFHAKKVAMLYLDNPYGTTLYTYAKMELEKLGATMVYGAKFEFPTTDFSSWLTEIKNQNPDLIILVGYYQHGVAITQARQLGINVPILGCEGFDSPKFIEITKQYGEGVVIVTDLNRDSKDPQVQYFLSKYKEMTGIPADMVGASAYDAVMVLAKAIQKAGSTNSDKIVSALESLQDYNGVAGKILRFTSSHNAVKYMTLQIVKNGEFHYYAEITEPDIITPSF